ncbi:MAG: hypothetical protein LJE69_09415 [Thiohalocapsa sp.]|jgi:hypothetical protein|uniref:hypothetical protein n=1 Tax=Thiohalocapsa sp. TaxID=2497641 RepID=UPI0025D229BC|nr:hypothetical protein [Thiohalocapsa sp.]MCG6941456.1 hypothetical protein [Thiohalocapsa sp.]
MTYRYRVFGLTVASALALPELVAISGADPADIEIELATLTPELENANLSEPHLQITPGVVQFSIEGVGHYRILRGSRILVDPCPDARHGDVRVWLLALGLAVAVHQRGLLPLHVSAVAIGSGAYAFCGESGAGKSTLAAALHRRGLPVLTDDVGLVVPEAQQVLLHPGFPRIKLWRDALEHFGMDHQELTRDFSRADKYHIRLTEGFHGRPLPLRGIYLLERASAEQPLIERVRGYTAIDLIRAQTYRWELLRELELSAEHLQACSVIAKRVRIFSFRRPWGLERLENDLDNLLEHMDQA